MDGGGCHPHTPAQQQRKSVEVWLANIFTDYKKVLIWKKSWCTLNVLLTQPNTQMFRVQSLFRGARHVEATIKTNLRIKSKTKEREMAFFSWLITAMLCAVEHTTQKLWEALGETMVGKNECTRRGLCCYQNTLHTTYYHNIAEYLQCPYYCSLLMWTYGKRERKHFLCENRRGGLLLYNLIQGRTT